MSNPSAPLAATDVGVTWWIFGLAFLFLIAGLALYLWVMRRQRTRSQQASNVIVWLLVAFAPTLVLFSLYPDSQVEGQFAGFTFGGAIGSLVAVWVIGTRLGRRGLDADREVATLRRTVAELHGEKATGGWGAPRRDDDPPLRDRLELRYSVRGSKKEIVIVTGDLLSVRQADVWVSSENTNMQMARYHERSISGMIRYYGATWDSDGEPVEDRIADHLRACMHERGKLVVPPAAVVATTAGRLESSNGVKRIYHVASVQGQTGAGYKPIAEMGRCVTAALDRMSDASEADVGARTILFPLLGTGVAEGAARDVAAQMVSAAAEYLSDRPDAPVRTVYLLAYRMSDLHHWVRAADKCQLLERLGGPVEQLIEAGTADAR